MDPTATMSLAFDGLIGLTALVSGYLAYRLIDEHGTVAAGYLAGALSITALVLAVLAVEPWLLDPAAGFATWGDLTLLAVGAVAGAIPVLLVGWALHHPTPFGWVEDRPKVALTGLAIPLFALLFLAIAWPGAPPADRSAITPEDPAYAEWAVWFNQYDTVEDATMSITAGTFLLAGPVLLGIFTYRWIVRRATPAGARARRSLAALALPPLAIVTLTAIAFLFQAALPPQSPWLDAMVSEGLVDTLLPGSFLVLPQLLWALSMLREPASPSPERGSSGALPA